MFESLAIPPTACLMASLISSLEPNQTLEFVELDPKIKKAVDLARIT